MNSIKIALYVIIFMIYSYLGSTFEHLSYYFGSDGSRKLLANPITEGFPLYGMGALFLYSTFKLLGLDLNSIGGVLSIFVLSAVAGTITEYFVGMNVGAGEYSGVSVEESAKAVQAWDYRNEPYSYKGIISLRHFIMWGIGGLAVAGLTPALERFVTAGLREIM